VKSAKVLSRAWAIEINQTPINTTRRYIMATSTIKSKYDGGTAAAQTQNTRAVTLWAAFGAFYLFFQLYSFAKWILSGDAKPVPHGVTPIPESMVHWATFWQTSLCLGSLWLFYAVVVKPWRRDGRLSTGGMLWFASETLWFQDAFCNWFTPVLSYNSILLNWGSWNASVPGWISFNAEKAVSPLVLYIGMYPLVFCGAPLLLANLMKKAKARWPQLGNVPLIAMMFVALGIFAVLAEGSWIQTGMYTYAGLWSPLTLWPDQPNKVPVAYIFIVDSMVFTGLACMMYFRDDKGLTFAEKGANSLGVTGFATLQRQLAIIGASCVIFVLGYTLPVNYFALRGTGWSPSVQEKSYFTHGICGDGTDYACPGGSVPTPLGTNVIHLAPDGTLVIPQGMALPKRVEHARD
jgi:Spirocyclase AveC-like